MRRKFLPLLSRELGSWDQAASAWLARPSIAAWGEERPVHWTSGICEACLVWALVCAWTTFAISGLQGQPRQTFYFQSYYVYWLTLESTLGWQFYEHQISFFSVVRQVVHNLQSYFAVLATFPIYYVWHFWLYSFDLRQIPLGWLVNDNYRCRDYHHDFLLNAS